MAEEEFDLDDDLDGDLGEDLDDQQVAAPPAAQANPKKKRLIIIAAVVGGVILLGGIIFGVRLFRSDEAPKNNGSKYAATEEVEKKKKKKKKKKIKYVEMFSNLEGEQSAKILKELSFADLSFSTEQNGKKYTILVDEDQVNEARNLLAIKGLPAGGIKGYELLDNAQTLGVTEFDKRVRFLRALSGELEKAIIQFEKIEDAKVQIVLPEQRLFSVTQPPVTSSILIRRTPGSELGDEVVFSIIQLVSNAVENLQPENVSVIDTEGIVLSEGIFERMAMRKQGIDPEREAEKIDYDGPKSLEEGFGTPIIPNYDAIRNWFDLKWEFEQTLVKRATQQLMGVLPVGSYKVAITSDIGAIEEGQIVDVRRLTVSVVVDNLNEDIYLDQTTKTQIFSTVAGAIGYVKGRDRINLTKADFTLLTPEEKEELEKLKNKGRFGRFLKKNWLYIVGALLGIGVVGWVVRWFRRRKKAVKPSVANEVRDEPEFSDLQNEIKNEKNIEQLKSLSDSNPQVLADLMEHWLQEELSEQEVAGDQEVGDVEPDVVENDQPEEEQA